MSASSPSRQASFAKALEDAEAEEGPLPEIAADERLQVPRRPRDPESAKPPAKPAAAAVPDSKSKEEEGSNKAKEGEAPEEGTPGEGEDGAAEEDEPEELPPPPPVMPTRAQQAWPESEPAERVAVFDATARALQAAFREAIPELETAAGAAAVAAAGASSSGAAAGGSGSGSSGTGGLFGLPVSVRMAVEAARLLCSQPIGPVEVEAVEVMGTRFSCLLYPGDSHRALRAGQEPPSTGPSKAALDGVLKAELLAAARDVSARWGQSGAPPMNEETVSRRGQW